MKELDAYLDAIKPLKRSFFRQAEVRLASQIRPAHSLGYLEELIQRIVAIQEDLRPSVQRKCVFVFAADHGVAAEEVSLYPREVTAQMVYSFLTGRATINVLARSVGSQVKVIDMGVDHDFPPRDDLVIRKIGYGTRNFTQGPAMTEAEVEKAFQVGVDLARWAKREGIELAATGDMGIGNTTASSALIAALTASRVCDVVGRGTGIDDDTWLHKVKVIETALGVNDRFLEEPIHVLQALGGFEIAGITGFVVGCAMERISVVIDGLISSAGALVALELHPSILDYVIFGHRSFERGQDAVLTRFGVRPLLDMDMRLGEGTGACLAMGLVDAAVQVFNQVATFEEARVATAILRKPAAMAAGGGIQ